MERESPRGLKRVTVPGHALYLRDERGIPARCRCGATSGYAISSTRGRREWQREHVQRVIASLPHGRAEADVVVEEARITYRQLDHWTRSQYLRATQNDHAVGKRGGKRWWDETERRIAILMGRLTRAGLSVEASAHVARAHIEHPTLSLSYQLDTGIDISITDFVS